MLCSITGVGLVEIIHVVAFICCMFCCFIMTIDLDLYYVYLLFYICLLFRMICSLV